MKNCRFYPTEDEIKNDPHFAPICGCGSDISGGPKCSKEDEKKCQWAIIEKYGKKCIDCIHYVEYNRTMLHNCDIHPFYYRNEKGDCKDYKRIWWKIWRRSR
jgi:hypothetical protein